ncbi:MAG: ATP synthase F0 subunit B [Candidatus Omnitrophica bacterium CG11_big_fil_rev_8_21_14_0_20_42_13]|uniref:ATP synthase subunit b n=1 Tax=Candidatus Ghiorseimicrobium undicola TaxID=1974746 RepID=A0A2H0LVW0_9BACT|nr:MAG: ATP synthase F0 subunit B [Candidatus Omnitrophica bacterium CG11_big_fil_rev_8_21_14_0_20_42_13]
MLPNATLIIEIASFLILLFIMKRLLYKPLLDFLDKRAKSIEESIKKAEEERNAANLELGKAKKYLDESKREALEFKHIAKKEADEFKQELLQEARFEAERIREYAKEDIAKEIYKARNELKKEAVGLAIGISEKLLAKNIDKATAERIAKDNVREIK